MTRNTAISERGQLGFTLNELLVVIAIISLLGMLGYPSYLDYVTRANRSAAKSLLLQIADRQEHFFADNKRYAGDLLELGYEDAAFPIDRQGAPLAPSSTDRLYGIALSDTSATSYTVNAVPLLGQATHDADCGALTLTHAGVKGQSGVATNCW